jgi:hypothetical protein
VPAIVRIPVIPRINDSEQAIQAIARHVAALESIRDVSLLAYHRFGESKYKMLDRRYGLGNVATPEDSQLERLATIVRISVSFVRFRNRRVPADRETLLTRLERMSPGGRRSQIRGGRLAPPLTFATAPGQPLDTAP